VPSLATSFLPPLCQRESATRGGICHRRSSVLILTEFLRGTSWRALTAAVEAASLSRWFGSVCHRPFTIGVGSMASWIAAYACPTRSTRSFVLGSATFVGTLPRMVACWSWRGPSPGGGIMGPIAPALWRPSTTEPGSTTAAWCRAGTRKPTCRRRRRSGSGPWPPSRQTPWIGASRSPRMANGVSRCTPLPRGRTPRPLRRCGATQTCGARDSGDRRASPGGSGARSQRRRVRPWGARAVTPSSWPSNAGGSAPPRPG
jgi:hypothetical protein